MGVTASLVLGGTISAAQAMPEGVSKSISRSASSHYSNEQVFRGALFGEGEVGKKLRGLVPEIDSSAEIDAEITKIVTDIESHEPGYLGRFAKLVQSGEVLEVKKAFDGVGDVLNMSLTRLGYNDAADSGSLSPQCITVVLFAAAALVYAAVAVLQIGAVATLQVYANKTKVKSVAGPGSGLTYDKWLAQVTKALAR